MKNRILKSIAWIMAAVFYFSAHAVEESLNLIPIALCVFSLGYLCLFVHLNKERFENV